MKAVAALRLLLICIVRPHRGNQVESHPLPSGGGRLPYAQCAPVCGCLCVCVCARALGIVSTDKIVRFINTLIIISYALCLMILSEWRLPVP